MAVTKVKTTSVAEPWDKLQPYLLGGHLMGAPPAHDWKRAFAQAMMPLLLGSGPAPAPDPALPPEQAAGLLGGLR